MPFDNPPVPSSFTIGDLTAGHATFDTTGVTFYSTDGVTALFHFDFATGVLTAVGTFQTANPPAARVEISSTFSDRIRMILNDVAETVVGVIRGAVGAGASRQATLSLTPSSLGHGAPSLVLTSASADNLVPASALVTAPLQVTNGGMVIDGSVTAGVSGTGAFIDSATGFPVPHSCEVTQRKIDAGEPNVNVDVNSEVTFPHNLGVLPVYAHVVGRDAIYQARYMRSLSDASNLVFLLNSRTGVNIASGTAVNLAYIAYG